MCLPVWFDDVAPHSTGRSQRQTLRSHEHVATCGRQADEEADKQAGGHAYLRPQCARVRGQEALASITVLTWCGRKRLKSRPVTNSVWKSTTDTHGDDGRFHKTSTHHT